MSYSRTRINKVSCLKGPKFHPIQSVKRGKRGGGGVGNGYIYRHFSLYGCLKKDETK